MGLRRPKGIVARAEVGRLAQISPRWAPNAPGWSLLCRIRSQKRDLIRGLAASLFDRGIMGPRPTPGVGKAAPVQQPLSMGTTRLPFVISPGEVMCLRPTQGDENGFCSATTLPGSTALSFVISTGAPKERSGEICGPFLEMFFLQEQSAGRGSRTARPRV